MDDFTRTENGSTNLGLEKHVSQFHFFLIQNIEQVGQGLTFGRIHSHLWLSSHPDSCKVDLEPR